MVDGLNFRRIGLDGSCCGFSSCSSLSFMESGLGWSAESIFSNCEWIPHLKTSFPELNNLHKWDDVNPSAAEAISEVLKNGRRDRLFRAGTRAEANLVIKEMQDAGEAIDGKRIGFGQAGKIASGIHGSVVVFIDVSLQLLLRT